MMTDMTTTQILASLIGLYFVSAGIGLLVERPGMQAMFDELTLLFDEQGFIDPENGRWVTGTYPEAIANAMWNYKFVLEDQSM